MAATVGIRYLSTEKTKPTHSAITVNGSPIPFIWQGMKNFDISKLRGLVEKYRQSLLKWLSVKRTWGDREGHWGRWLWYVIVTKVICSFRKSVFRDVRTDYNLDLRFLVKISMIMADLLQGHIFRGNTRGVCFPWYTRGLCSQVTQRTNKSLFVWVTIVLSVPTSQNALSSRWGATNHHKNHISIKSDKFPIIQNLQNDHKTIFCCRKLE